MGVKVGRSQANNETVRTNRPPNVTRGLAAPPYNLAKSPAPANNRRRRPAPGISNQAIQSTCTQGGSNEGAPVTNVTKRIECFPGFPCYPDTAITHHAQTLQSLALLWWFGSWSAVAGWRLGSCGSFADVFSLRRLCVFLFLFLAVQPKKIHRQTLNRPTGIRRPCSPEQKWPQTTAPSPQSLRRINPHTMHRRN